MACESGMGHTSDVILGNLKQEVVPCLVSDDPLDVVSHVQSGLYRIFLLRPPQN